MRKRQCTPSKKHTFPPTTRSSPCQHTLYPSSSMSDGITSFVHAMCDANMKTCEQSTRPGVVVFAFALFRGADGAKPDRLTSSFSRQRGRGKTKKWSAACMHLCPEGGWRCFPKPRALQEVEKLAPAPRLSMSQFRGLVEAAAGETFCITCHISRLLFSLHPSHHSVQLPAIVHS